MPGNKKPKKRYRPRAPGSTSYLDHLTQRARMPWEDQLNDGDRTSLLMVCHQSLEAIRTGQGDVNDMGNLEMCATLSSVLCACGIGTDYLDVAEEARTAVSQVVERWRTKGRALFAGQEYPSINHMLELYAQQIEHEDMTIERTLKTVELAQQVLREQAERYYKKSNKHNDNKR